MQRRLPNPLLDKREHEPSPVGRIVTRVLLIAAAVVALLLAALLYLPGERLLVHYWIYIVVIAAPIILLLGALTVKLHQSIRSKWPRVIVTALMAFLLMCALTVVYSLSAVYSQVGMNPVAYYTNPDNGNRLVIMRAADFDNTPDDAAKPEYIYGAYPMSGKLFYYPLRGDMVATKTGIDYVEWVDGGMGAAVHITDREGVEQIISLSFDFSQPVEPEQAEE